ncbi:MAG: sigma-70 family RNA polymerase sigma factor, partial [Syntrophomonadaceae bacterium]|nr:sigma-70 family RNA polymerase sigma factor [Syntrophomonadaceae bacterium]
MERKTLDDIYRFYMLDIYRYLYSLCHNHYLAEDLLQETFYRAYLHLEDCRGEKVKPWLFRVAYNAFIDVMRQQKRRNLTT